jgi:uncharacterized protein (UPF0332 family)
VSLEELLRDRIVHKIRSNSRLAVKALGLAKRDLRTAKKLLESGDYDWSLAIAYNAMLQAGRALMFNMGYRPSSSQGHVAMMKFLRAVVGREISGRLIIFMDRVRRKRHRIVYEEAEITSESEVEEGLKWADEFINKVKGML